VKVGISRCESFPDAVGSKRQDDAAGGLAGFADIRRARWARVTLLGHFAAIRFEKAPRPTALQMRRVDLTLPPRRMGFTAGSNTQQGEFDSYQTAVGTSLASSEGWKQRV